MLIQEALIGGVVCGYRETCRDSEGLPVHSCLHCCGPVLLGGRVKFPYPTQAVDVDTRVFRGARERVARTKCRRRHARVRPQVQRLALVLSPQVMRVNFVNFLVDSSDS